MTIIHIENKFMPSFNAFNEETSAVKENFAELGYFV